MILCLTDPVYQEISGFMQLAQADLDWARVSLLPSRPYSTHVVPRHAVLGFAFERQSGVHAIDGNRREDFDAWPGELAITQAGTEMFSESADGGEYLTIDLGTSEETEALLHHIKAPRRIIAGDSQVFAMGLGLRRLLLSRPTESLVIEEHVTRLLGAIRTAVARVTDASTLTRNRQMAAVLEYIDAHLSSPLQLNDMARIAGLSRLQFLRSFARAVGLTPHAFVTERRLQHARKGLSEGNTSLASLAADCGFAHQSHLGALLGRQIGLTPGRYRILTSRRAKA